jgi:hypothetical protein
MQYEDLCRLIFEGYIRGKQSPWFMTVNWHDLLDKPIEEVRYNLGLKKFTAWEEIKPEWYKLLKSYKKYTFFIIGKYFKNSS